MSDVKVVIADIPLGDPGRGAYAFRVGDRISADVVSANNWSEYVAGESTQSAQAAVAQATGTVKGS